MASTITVDNIIGKTATGNVHIPGHVVQIKYSEKTTTQAISSYNAWIDISGLSIDITPKYQNSLIYLTVHCRAGNDQSWANGMRLLKDNSIVVGENNNNSLGNIAYNIGGTRPYIDTSSAYFNIAGTTSLVNYKIQARAAGGGFNFNGRGGETNDSKYCQLIAMEIAQ